MPIESGVALTGPQGPPGPGTIVMINTPSITPPTARDADLIIPSTVDLTRQVTFEVQLRCRNNTTLSWRLEAHLVTLSVKATGQVQISNQQLGSAVNSSAPFNWSGAVILSWSTYADGTGRRVRVSCFGPNNATLPAGCTWVGQAIKKEDFGGLT
jgi:hypothetical protein